MSLLLANGHPDAGLYPIGRVHDEAELVSQRISQQMASESVLIQLAVSSVLSEDAGKLFGQEIKRLSEE